VSGSYDAATRSFDVDEGDIGNANVGVALSGSMDFSGSDVRFRAGVAGTSMSAETLKRLWPVFVARNVRDWFLEHLISGTVKRLVIAINAPLNTLKPSGPPIPDDGLALDAVATNCVIRLVQDLPALRDADLNVHVVGRDAKIALNEATVDLPSGRTLIVSSEFAVADFEKTEPSARISIHLSGLTSGALELLATDRIRTLLGPLSIRPTTVRGTITAQATLAFPLNNREISNQLNYAATAQVSNLVIDRFRGEEIEADTLQIDATTNSYKVTGLARINHVPTKLNIVGELPFPGRSN
jgi:hypothetical protein